jgi:hypothetical protein
MVLEAPTDDVDAGSEQGRSEGVAGERNGRERSI